MNKKVAGIKSVKLTEYTSSTVNEKELSERGRRFLKAIIDLAQSGNLSYLEINKALYLADKELYIKALIHKKFEE